MLSAFLLITSAVGADVTNRMHDNPSESLSICTGPFAMQFAPAMHLCPLFTLILNNAIEYTPASQLQREYSADVAI